MKVVLFCGGMGTRLRDYSEHIPKPLMPVGYRPVMWHLMKYYASFGYNDFVLCLGYKADVIKRFFLDYNEAVSNDFVLSGGGRRIDMLATDIDDWKITFVDTGIYANLGERLMAVRRHLADEDVFMANYSDGLTDLALDTYLEDFRAAGKVAQFLAVRPPLSYHFVTSADDGLVTDMGTVDSSDIWINGGYFVFRNDIFDFIQPGEDLVIEPFHRLMKEGQLVARKYSGFWAPMDTFKDKQRLDDLYAAGDAPWQVWKQGEG